MKCSKGCILLLAAMFLNLKCDTYHTKIKNIICLIDFSNSISHAKLADYAYGIKMILYAMGPEDRLIVYPIDEGSITDRVAILYEDFRNANNLQGVTFKNLNLPDSISPPFKKKGENVFTASVNKPKRLNGYLKVIEPLLVQRLDSIKRARKKYGDRSDILSAIYSVKDDLVNQDRAEWMPGEVIENYLLIFSDLVQDSELANFDTKNGIKWEEVKPLIEKVKKDNLMPDLRGAKVIVYDNYSNTKAAHSSTTKKRIREFWDAYFSDTTINVYKRTMKYQNSSSMDGVLTILREY